MRVDGDSFRGLSGEVVVTFIAPATIISAVPVLILFALAIAASVLLIPDRLAFLQPLPLLLVSAVAVGRFAIPASRGALHEGWFTDQIERGETLAYALRYLLLTVLWLIPAAGLSWLAVELGGERMAMGMMFGGPSFTAYGFAGVLLLLVALIAIFAPTLAFIICAGTTRLREVVSLEPWRRLLGERRGDLVVFYAAMIGGFAVFWLIYALPLVVIVVAISAISEGAGAAAGGFILLLPVTMTPILMGRLAGALVAGAEEEAFEDTVEIEAMEPADDDPAPRAEPPAALPDDQAEVSRLLPTEPGVQEKVVKRVEETQTLHLENACLLANNRLKARPADPVAAAELVLLRCRAARLEGIEELAEKAIRINLKADNRLLAAKLYTVLGTARDHIDLQPEEYRQLAEHLQQLGGYLAAALCVVKGAAAYDIGEVEKRLEQLAGQARARNRERDVAGIEKLIAKRSPAQ